jgi:hypothetical protein
MPADKHVLRDWNQKSGEQKIFYIISDNYVFEVTIVAGKKKKAKATKKK